MAQRAESAMRVALYTLFCLLMPSRSMAGKSPPQSFDRSLRRQTAVALQLASPIRGTPCLSLNGAAWTSDMGRAERAAGALPARQGVDQQLPPVRPGAEGATRGPVSGDS